MTDIREEIPLREGYELRVLVGGNVAHIRTPDTSAALCGARPKGGYGTRGNWRRDTGTTLNSIGASNRCAKCFTKYAQLVAPPPDGIDLGDVYESLRAEYAIGRQVRVVDIHSPTPGGTVRAEVETLSTNDYNPHRNPSTSKIGVHKLLNPKFFKLVSRRP